MFRLLRQLLQFVGCASFSPMFMTGDRRLPMFNPSPPSGPLPEQDLAQESYLRSAYQLERFSHAYFPLAVVPAPGMPLTGSASVRAAPFAMVVIATAIRSLISPLRAMKRAARFQMSRRSNGSQHRAVATIRLPFNLR